MNGPVVWPSTETWYVTAGGGGGGAGLEDGGAAPPPVMAPPIWFAIIMPAPRPTPSFAVWETTRPLGVVVASEAALTEGPSSSTAGVARVSQGEVLEVGREADGWRPARVGRARGWVRAGAVERI